MRVKDKIKKISFQSIVSLVVVSALSQILAFLRESIFAYFFGASEYTDAYIMANQIPVILFSLVGTAINTVLLPIYLSEKELKGEKEGYKFLKSFMIIFLLVAGLLTVIVEIKPISLVKLFAPYYEGNTLVLTIKYLRILFPIIILTGIINIFAVVYKAENQFLTVSFAALIQSVSIIVGTLLFANYFGMISVVYCTAVGVLLNAFIIVIGKYKILLVKVDLKDKIDSMKQVLIRIIPITLGDGLGEINKIIDKAIASRLPSGSVSLVNYSSKLTTSITALLLLSITNVALKKFIDLYNKGNNQVMKNCLKAYLDAAWMFIVPLSVGCFSLSENIIKIIYGHGVFDNDSITITAGLFKIYALGMPFVVIRNLVAQYYFAKGNTLYPMINSCIAVVLNIVFNIILSSWIGVFGLAFATTIANTIAGTMLILRCSRKEVISFNYLICNVKYFVAGAIMVLIVCNVMKIYGLNNIYGNTIITVLMSVVIYIVFLYIVWKDNLKESILLLISKIN
jgi:putative peptidoglycan lipid II flippase